MDEIVGTTGTPSCQSCLYKEQYPTISGLLDFFFFFEGGFVNRLAQGGRGHISLSKSLKSLRHLIHLVRTYCRRKPKAFGYWPQETGY